MGAVKYEIKTRLCSIHRSQFRWTVFEDGNPVQFSMKSHVTEAEAIKDGMAVLTELERISKLNTTIKRSVRHGRS